MVITESEKKVLLERLALAREAKQKKAKEAKEAKQADVAPPPVISAAAISAAAISAAPVPEVVAPVPVAEPMVWLNMPEEVGASGKKKPTKKVKLPDSDEDSEEEAVLPPKKKKIAQKETAYMKIKIYREPKNAENLQNLLAAVQDEQGPEQEPVPEPQPPTWIKPPRLLVQQIGGRAVKSFDTDAARKELLRRQAMDFFA